MVRASNFAASSGKRHKSTSIRTAKEAPATLSRPFNHSTANGSSFTHTPSRSMPSARSASIPSGLSSLQAIQALLGELDSLPKFPRHKIEVLSVLRYAVMLISWQRAPITIFGVLLLEFVFVEGVYQQRHRRTWLEGIGALKLKLRALSKTLLTSSKDFDSIYQTVII
jgi:hypothetical protein